MSSISEFWKALNSFKPAAPKVHEYRVYYEGNKIVKTICNPVDADWPEGLFIVLTKEQYSNLSLTNYNVVNNKLVRKIHHGAGVLLELAEDGEYTSLPNNIIFVADEGDNYKVKEIE